MNNDEVQEAVKNMKTHFPFLFDRGFRVTYTHFDEESFGNWIVVLGSPEFNVMLIQDRSELLLSMGSGQRYSNQGRCVGLELLIYFLTNEKDYIASYDGDLHDQTKQYQRLAEIFQRYYSQIFDVMVSDFDKNYYSIMSLKSKVFELSQKEVLERIRKTST
jgi:hypothetical protein